MAETVTRTRVCDHCGRDLTVTDEAYGWHYALDGKRTPTTSMIGYDPHPEPPETAHFCDKECLALWVGNTFGKEISYEMFDAGANILAETEKFGTIGNYVEQRRLASKIFTAMWEVRARQGRP